MRRIFLSCLGLTASAFGELAWESQSEKRTASASEQESIVVYRFVNRGPQPVRLTKLESTCDCTIPETAKKEYAPGEKGEVSVKFLIAGRVGLQRKSIEVQTDDSAAPKTTLTLTVDIQQPVQMAPTVLWWRIGEEKKTQHIHITANEKSPLSISTAECPDQNWTISLRTIKPGLEYYLDATPEDTAKPSAALVTFRSEGNREKIQSLNARLRVQ